MNLAHLLQVHRWLLVLALPACFQSSSDRDELDASSTDSAVDASTDAPAPIDVALPMDTRPMDTSYDAVDADVFGALTPEQAECLGLTAPECAACHRLGGGWVLRPPSPPPPDVMPPPSGDCGPLP